MIAVIFELIPNVSEREEYLQIAARLHDQLKAVHGFISIERFESLSAPGKLLSLSFWRDEHAISTWRNLPEHRDAQRAGRKHIFGYYRLRVAAVTRDYGMNKRGEAPADSLRQHDG